MAIYFLLGTLTERGQRLSHEDYEHIQKAVNGTPRSQTRILGQYAVLGHYDHVMLVEADRNSDVAELSVRLGYAAGMKFETLTGISPSFLHPGQGPGEEENRSNAEAEVPRESRPESRPTFLIESPAPAGARAKARQAKWGERLAVAQKSLEEWVDWRLGHAGGDERDERMKSGIAGSFFLKAARADGGLERQEDRRTAGILAVCAYAAAGEKEKLDRAVLELGVNGHTLPERNALAAATGGEPEGEPGNGPTETGDAWSAYLERLTRAIMADRRETGKPNPGTQEGAERETGRRNRDSGNKRGRAVRE